MKTLSQKYFTCFQDKIVQLINTFKRLAFTNYAQFIENKLNYNLHLRLRAVSAAKINTLILQLILS